MPVIDAADAADDAADAAEDDPPRETHYKCECGQLEPSMDHFVEHVSSKHEALDIAVRALLREEIEVTGRE